MIALFKNIENYKDLCLRDMAFVAWNFDFFVPPSRVDEYIKEVDPLLKEAKEKTRFYFNVFAPEREKLAKTISKYYDPVYFNQIKSSLKNNMFDTNYALKGYLEKMTKEQLVVFGALVCAWYVKCYLFMTFMNWVEFTNEIAHASKYHHGNLLEQMQRTPKAELSKILLDHINLNIILADNTAETILYGSNAQEAYAFIDQVLTLREKNHYRARILM